MGNHCYLFYSLFFLLLQILVIITLSLPTPVVVLLSSHHTKLYFPFSFPPSFPPYRPSIRIIIPPVLFSTSQRMVTEYYLINRKMHLSINFLYNNSINIYICMFAIKQPSQKDTPFFMGAFEICSYSMIIPLCMFSS